MAAKRKTAKLPPDTPSPKRAKSLATGDWLAELIPEAWRAALAQVTCGPAWDALRSKLEACTDTVYPERENIFRALALVAPADVRVVILGQDPYHGPGQAHGLAFSVPDGTTPPPTLRNIRKQVGFEYGEAPTDLTCWAEQGVLLLNTCLTVSAGQAGSHAGWGWEEVTDAVIAAVCSAREGVVFMLWGKKAQQAQVDGERHTIITAPHPSPLSAYRGFHDRAQFTLANEALTEPVRWEA